MVPRASCSLDTTLASCHSICGGPPSANKGAEQRLAEQRLIDVGGAWKPTMTHNPAASMVFRVSFRASLFSAGKKKRIHFQG